jgi:hypothetical protein
VVSRFARDHRLPYVSPSGDAPAVRQPLREHRPDLVVPGGGHPQIQVASNAHCQNRREPDVFRK